MNTSLVPVGSATIVSVHRIPIAGLQNHDEWQDVSLWYLRVVQPTSTDTFLMEGGDAKQGQFLDTTLRLAFNQLRFALIGAEKFSVV